MDKLSLFGILVAVIALGLGQTLDGGQFSSLFNGPAFLIVVGGSIGAIMVQVPSDVFQRSLGIFHWVFVPPLYNFQLTSNKIIGWSEVARREGILGLEKSIGREADGFTRKGLQLLVDGNDPVAIRTALEVDIDTHEDFDMMASKVYESMGGYTPTLGILGAVMGLIHVMENLSNPETLGHGIATAFVATIYGVGLANLFLLPTAKKLQRIIVLNSRKKEMILEGLIGIAQGDNPRNIAQRLESFHRIQYATSK